MARIQHGQAVSLDELEAVLDQVKALNTGLGVASSPIKISGLTPFGYLLEDLQSDPAALLPSQSEDGTVAKLIRLGETMNDLDESPNFDSMIPSAYTYFGQFVSHDITLEFQSDELRDLNEQNLEPLSLDEVRNKIKNKRTPTVDLDSVYGVTSDGTPVPRDCAELTIAAVIPSGMRPENKDPFNDLPRKPRSNKPEIDREALIADARNDENLIQSQLHVAFLRAHRSLARRGLSFNEAKKTLTQHYQWLIIHDFLMRIADQKIINDILTYGNKFYRPPVCGLYMPLEFSAAAYRFGHSMIRSSYDYNVNFQNETKATLDQLFSLTAFSGELADCDHLPEKWIIQWENFLEGGTNVARSIDTRLVEPLSRLTNVSGHKISGIKGSLAIRNLLRGYLLRLPVGQSAAKALGCPVLSSDEIRAIATNVSEEQAKVMSESGFLTRTPLWYYILAEATDRNQLGPVGSTLVAEVLIGLVRWSDDSILSEPGWKPTLGANPGRFTLLDFFRLAGVWG